MSGSVCQVETGYVGRVGDERPVPPNLSAGNKAPCCGVTKLAPLDADLRVEGGVKADLIGKRSSVGERFYDNEVIGTWGTH